MNNTKKLALTLATSVALAASGGGIAGTDTGTITVQAQITNSCTIGDATLDAAAYNPLTDAADDFDFETTVALTCTNGATADIGLNAGGGAGATVAARKMTAGGHTLTYTIYQDDQHSVLWGNTIGTNTLQVTGTGSNDPQTLYGRIPSGQANAFAGNYTDSVTITVTF
jgi:spore coat protein U-like protein